MNRNGQKLAVSIISCHKFRKFESKFKRSRVSKAKTRTLKAPGKAVTASEVVQFCIRYLFDYIFISIIDYINNFHLQVDISCL